MTQLKISTATVSTVKTGRSHHTPPTRNGKKFLTNTCGTSPCYVKGHGHLKARNGKTGYGLRSALNGVTQNPEKKSTRSPEIVPCPDSRQAYCGNLEPHYHYEGHSGLIVEDRLEDQNECIEHNGCTHLRGLANQLVKDKNRIAELIATPVECPDEEDLDDDAYHQDFKHDLTPISEEDDLLRKPLEISEGQLEPRVEHPEHELKYPEILPVTRDLSIIKTEGDKVSLASGEKVCVEHAQIAASYVLGNIMINMWTILSTQLPPTKNLISCTEPIKEPEYSTELEERIIYSTLETGAKYDDTFYNHVIMWLSGSVYEHTRNNKMEQYLPELVQFVHLENVKTGKFCGINMENWLYKKHERRWWWRKKEDWWVKGTKYNGVWQRPDVFDAIKLLGYKSHTIEWVIKPLLTYLNTIPTTQSRQMIGTDGQYRAFTPANIMIVAQAHPDYLRLRALGEKYFENTIAYYCTLMAIRDIHRLIREPKCSIPTTITSKPGNGCPSVQSFTPNRGGSLPSGCRK